MKRLPDTELEVMKALWDSGPDTPRAALERALAPHGWAANTINTYPHPAGGQRVSIRPPPGQEQPVHPPGQPRGLPLL